MDKNESRLTLKQETLQRLTQPSSGALGLCNNPESIVRTATGGPFCTGLVMPSPERDELQNP
jgi:hypothetical protein